MNTTQYIQTSLHKRYRKERIFRMFGLSSVIMGCLFLILLFGNMMIKAIPAFTQTTVTMNVTFDPNILKIPKNTTDTAILEKGKFRSLVNSTLYQTFPKVTQRKEKRLLKKLVSTGMQYQLRDMLIDTPHILGTTQTVEFMLDDDVDTFIKAGGLISDKKVSDRLRDAQITWIKQWAEQGKINERFNWSFFTHSDSRNPELAGIKGAVIGTLLTMLVTMLLAFPIGVLSAVYLEEFAPKNKWTELIEVNINNLAAVPSIVFGLLGLAIFINFFGLPRSKPLVGGLVLALMTLPTVIISSRSAIKAVPPSLKEAALGLGASKMQAVFHHVLPQSMSGILTGAIIGIAQAIGETAPLLMIGMVAFIVDIPQSIMDDASVLPVQIYLWADSPERAFEAKTSAAILVLLAVLILINMSVVFLRKKLEKKRSP